MATPGADADRDPTLNAERSPHTFGIGVDEHVAIGFALDKPVGIGVDEHVAIGFALDKPFCIAVGVSKRIGTPIGTGVDRPVALGWIRRP